MAQGYTGYNIIDNEITIKDSPNLDAFSRFRVSNPLTIFSNQFTYDLSPLIFDTYTNTANYIITHDGVNRLANIDFIGAGVGEYVYMQSFEYIPYQPGRSQLVFITFNLFPGGSITNDANKIVGLGDDNNGFFYRYNANTGNNEFMLMTSTSAGAQVIDQANWNLDKLNGTGASGQSINFNRTQILVIDFQALYVGRVRLGFDIDGEIIYAHEFLNANNLVYPYIATANLPIRVGMESVVVSSNEELDFICCSVASEGGSEDAQRFGYNFTFDGSVTSLASGGGPVYISSLRPTATFAGYTNRIKFVLESIDFMNIGNKQMYYQLGIGATIGGASYTSVNSNYSGMEADTTGTASVNPTLIIDSGYIPSGGGSRNVSIASTIQSKYPITLDAAGNFRDLGTLFLFGEGIGGTTNIYYTLKWKEIR